MRRDHAAHLLCLAPRFLTAKKPNSLAKGLGVFGFFEKRQSLVSTRPDFMGPLHHKYSAPCRSGSETRGRGADVCRSARRTSHVLAAYFKSYERIRVLTVPR